MAIGFEKKMFDSGTSKVVTIPSRWAEGKETIGLIVFDLKDKKDHKMFYEHREKLLIEE